MEERRAVGLAALNIEGLNAEERLEMIRYTLYSDSALAEKVVQVLLIADPGAVDDMAEYLEMRKAAA